MLPAARVHDGLAAPDAGGAVEVEEMPRTVAAAVLEDEVRIQQDRLHLGEKRIVLIDVSPARLHHRDLRIGKEWNGPLQEIRRRDEVGVEDRDELAFRDRHPRFERASLVAGTVGAVQVGDVDPLRGIATHRAFGDLAGFVRRIVQDLNLEQLARVIDLTHGVDQTIGDVHLVVDRKLDGDRRQGRQRPVRHGTAILVLHVQVDQVVPVPPVDRKNDKNEEVRGEYDCFGGSHTMCGPAINTSSDYIVRTS